MLCKNLVLLAAACLVTRLPQDGKEDFKRERKPDNAARKDALEGKAPPPLPKEGWVNTDGKPLDLAKLAGKVVVLKFWGVWCGPCVASMPHMQELIGKHPDLVFVGIHTKGSGEKMPAFMTEKKLTFPCVVDKDETTIKAYSVDSYPDYYLIDRTGKLRFADLANGDLDKAIAFLLAEPAPKAASRPAR